MLSDADLVPIARQLRDVIEPVTAQVYFAPECHEGYESLGFKGSPATARGVAMPDGAAYFTSRGSCVGQVPGQVVASTFAVFNPDAVVPAVDFGWSLTDAPTINAIRTKGGVAQLRRVLGDEPAGLRDATDLLRRATEPLRPEGRSLYAGLLALGLPGDPMGDMWRLGDLLREFRGDAHTAAWTSAGADATEIGLLTELWWGMPPRTYVRTRAWTNEQLDAAEERLRGRGLIGDDGLTPEGRQFREGIETVTDVQLRPAIEALGDDASRLFEILKPWGSDIRAAGGYPAGPSGITRDRT